MSGMNHICVKKLFWWYQSITFMIVATRDVYVDVPVATHQIKTKFSKGLVTIYGEGGGGGATKREGGAREVLPLRKGGAERVLAILKGGHKMFWGCFYTIAWSFSHIVGGGALSFHSLKGGARKVLPCLEGGAQKVSDPRFSHFVAPPPRN